MSGNPQATWVQVGQVGVDSGRLTILDHCYIQHMDDGGAPVDDFAKQLLTMIETGDGIFRVFVRRCEQTGIVCEIRMLSSWEDFPPGDCP